MVDSGGLENRCGRKSTQSSNLCPTVEFSRKICWFWRVGRVVECGGFENRCRRKATGGSNPPLSVNER